MSTPWRQKPDENGQIKTVVKSPDLETFKMRVETLLDKGWTVINDGTYTRNDSMEITVANRRGARGMSKTSATVCINKTSVGFWCKMLSPKREEVTEKVAL